MDLGTGVLEIPHKDVLIETSRGDETRIRRPGDRIDDGAVELPSVLLELSAVDVPDVDGAIFAS